MEYMDNNLSYKNEINLKIIVLGKRSIGKSYFCKQINLNYSKFKKWNLIYAPTDEFEFYKFNIKLRNKYLVYQYMILLNKEFIKL